MFGGQSKLIVNGPGATYNILLPVVVFNMKHLFAFLVILCLLSVNAWLLLPVTNKRNNGRMTFGTRDPSTFLSVASTTGSTKTIVDRSTLTLLEHINLNVPTQNPAIHFYLDVLGCGLDPRKAANLGSPQKTIWANCGASQFHLPYGETAQVIPGHIGLRFNSLNELKERLDRIKETYASAVTTMDSAGREQIRIVDLYGNTFVCRASQSGQQEEAATTSQLTMRQPIILPHQTNEWGEIATRYGKLDSDCKGIDYVEFQCPAGKAERIALFYESVLDATTSTVQDLEGSSIAIIAVGNVDESGRSEQCLLFRETSDPIPPYDGHHIALYVGESAADFEQAFHNAQLANIVWCNPRFSDQVTSLDGLRKEQQFRFKNIVDMETGETIMELEHEMRSIDHKAWPGGSTIQ